MSFLKKTGEFAKGIFFEEVTPTPVNFATQAVAPVPIVNTGIPNVSPPVVSENQELINNCKNLLLEKLKDLSIVTEFRDSYDTLKDTITDETKLLTSL